MLLTFKTLKQFAFKLEVDESSLVADVKEKIKQARPKEFGESKLKLISNGKILEDDKALSEYGVSESGFVVVMAQIVKPTKESPPEPEKKPETSPLGAEKPSAPVAAAQATSTPTAASSESPAPNAPSQSNDLLSGPSLDAAIKNMVEMGFAMPMVQQALRLSFNNPDRAVEYLISGNLPQEVPQDSAAAPIGTAQEQGSDGTQEETAFDPEALRNLSSEDIISTLARLPQIQQLRALRDDPALLQQFIQQLADTYPDVVRAIQANENAFMEFINAPPEEGAESSLPDQPVQHVIRLTEQEKSAIDRLKALGFPEEDVIQAYFACDKNEELAANLLFSDNQDDAV